MKKEHVIGLCLIVLIAGIVGVALLSIHSLDTTRTNTNNESHSGQTKGITGELAGSPLSYKIIVNAPKLAVPGKITVYKTQTPAVTKADAITLAKKFNITNINDPKEGDSVISVSSKDMRYRVMLYKTGGGTFWDSERSDTPNGIDVPENLPSDDKAIEIATTFLKERNLLPDGAIVGGVTHGKAYTTSNGKTWVSWEDILVYYNRELNGMKVEGTQFEVEVGGHGDIIRFFSNWKDYEAIGEYSIKSRESSIDTLKQNGIAIGTGPDKPDTVSINEIYLAYDTTAVAYKEDYLKPVWVFKGEALKNGSAVMPVKEFVPALTDDSVRSLSL